jgi:hypothetical protein
MITWDRFIQGIPGSAPVPAASDRPGEGDIRESSFTALLDEIARDRPNRGGGPGPATLDEIALGVLAAQTVVPAQLQDGATTPEGDGDGRSSPAERQAGIAPTILALAASFMGLVLGRRSGRIRAQSSRSLKEADDESVD